MPDADAPPPAILVGIRACAVVADAHVAATLHPVSGSSRWAANLAVDLKAAPLLGLAIPTRSEWVVIVDGEYPLGSIEVFPAAANGITQTFPHQEINGPPGPGERWTSGKICVDTQLRRVGLLAAGIDPVGDPEARLCWYVARTVAWVHAAARGSLLDGGDPFEVPRAPRRLPRLVHDEGERTLAAWVGRDGQWGLVETGPLAGIEETRCVSVFRDHAGRDVRSVPTIASTGDVAGGWWLWPQVVVAPPWKVPLTWGELRAIGTAQGVDVDATLRSLAHRLRGTDANLLMIGYRIPKSVGGEAVEVHWEAIEFPPLRKDGSVPNGFRPNDEGWWRRDRVGAFRDGAPLRYLVTENWHPARAQARGRLPIGIRDQRIAVLGCGSLGSLVAELLVRGGATDVLLVDGDAIVIGNLVRHTLSGTDLDENKAEALARRLAAAAPFARVVARATLLPVATAALEELLEDRSVVIDCTGSEAVPIGLARAWWSIPRLFVCASVGYGATRTFLFKFLGHAFPEREFRGQIEPWLREEREKWCASGETREGAGCYSPFIPGGMSDLFLSAAACVKFLAETSVEPHGRSQLVVFEQDGLNGFAGLRRLTPESQASTPT